MATATASEARSRPGAHTVSGLRASDVAQRAVDRSGANRRTGPRAASTRSASSGAAWSASSAVAVTGSLPSTRRPCPCRSQKECLRDWLATAARDAPTAASVRRARRGSAVAAAPSCRTCRRRSWAPRRSNAHRSGSCHCGDSVGRKLRRSSNDTCWPSPTTTVGQRALAPPLVGHADDRGLAHGRVGHQLVLQLDRGDPLAAGLDDVLGAVGQGQEAVGADARRRRRSAASRRRTSPRRRSA